MELYIIDSFKKKKKKKKTSSSFELIHYEHVSQFAEI